MSYTKAEQLYEGKAKKVFAIKENPDYVMVSYKDDATAFNGLKKGQIHGKGVINNKMTNYMFSFARITTLLIFVPSEGLALLYATGTAASTGAEPIFTVSTSFSLPEVESSTCIAGTKSA